jgi:hypothetical protein
MRLFAGTRLVASACAGLAALGAAVAIAGCAPAASPQGSLSPRPTASVTFQQAQAPVLASSAIGWLPAQTRALTPHLLAEDATIKGLQHTITGMGFIGGRERIFQGNSKRLTFVDSRALVFKTSAGAAQYLAYVHAHSADFFGLYPSVSGLVSGSAAGWMFEPQPCACHAANPAVVGIAQRGSVLLWLEINGPAATASALRALLSQLG